MLSSSMHGRLTGADDPRVIYVYNIIKELYPTQKWSINADRMWSWGAIYFEPADADYRLSFYNHNWHIHMRKVNDKKIGFGHDLHFDDHEKLKKVLADIIDSVL